MGICSLFFVEVADINELPRANVGPSCFVTLLTYCACQCDKCPERHTRENSKYMYTYTVAIPMFSVGIYLYQMPGGPLRFYTIRGNCVKNGWGYRIIRSNKSDIKTSKNQPGYYTTGVAIHVVGLPTGGLMHSRWLCESTGSWSSLMGHRVL